MLKRLILLALCGASTAGLIVASRPRFIAWAQTRNRVLVPAFYVLSRIGLYFVLYFVIRSTMPGDLQAFYYPQADKVLSGELPGRDFPTAYSPLFPFLLALAYLPFPEDFMSAPVLLFIVADLVCLLLLRSVARDTLGGRSVDQATWIFILCPLTWVVSVHYAQDEILTALVVVLPLYLIGRNRCSLAGLATGLGIALTKATTAVAALIFLSRPQSKSPLKEMAFGIVPLAIVYGAFLYLGANPFKFASGEGGQAAGYSISSLAILVLYSLGMHSIDNVAAVLTVVLCPLTGLAIGIVMGRRRRLPLDEFVALVFLCFFLLSLKSICIYRAWIVCPMILVALRRRCVPLFALWSLNSAFVMTFPNGSPLVHIQAVLGIIIELALIRVILSARHEESPAIPAWRTSDNRPHLSQP